MEKKYYIAGGFDRKGKMRELVQIIARETGWECTARWIEDGAHIDFLRQQCAMDDYDDIFKASTFVLTGTTSTSGGKWTELGLAYEMKKRIIYFRPDGQRDDWNNVFLHLPGIQFCRTIGELCSLIRDCEEWESP